MESGSGFKSMAFITLSGICHGICVAAIGLAPSAHLPSGGNAAVEVAVNDSAPAEMAAAGAPQTEAAKATEAATTAAPAAAVTPAAPAVQKSIAPIAKKSIAKKSVTKKIVMVEPAATDEEIQKEIAAETGTPIEAVAEETAPTEQAATAETETEAPAAATTPEETATTNQEASTDSKAEATDTAAATPAAAVGAATAADAATATNNAGETAGTENAGAGAGNATEPTTAGQIEGTRSFQSLTQKAGNRAPEYPIEARAQNRQGNVELIYFVNKEGLVEQAKVATSSGHADLDQAALNTISNYRFVPGQEGWTRHAVNFSLKGETASQPARLRTMGAQGR